MGIKDSCVAGGWINICLQVLHTVCDYERGRGEGGWTSLGAGPEDFQSPEAFDHAGKGCWTHSRRLHRGKNTKATKSNLAWVFLMIKHVTDH